MVIGGMGDGCRRVEAVSRSLKPNCVGVGNVVFLQGLESSDLAP